MRALAFALLALLASAQATNPETAAYEHIRALGAIRNPTPAQLEEYHRRLLAYINLPEKRNADYAGRTYTEYFRFLVRQHAPDTELLDAIRGLERYGRFPGSRYIEPVTVLVERKLKLDYAEALARKAIPATAEYLQRFPDREFERTLPAEAHDALGWVLHVEGRDDEAVKELTTAHALNSENTNVLYHLGSIAEQRGKFAEAAEWYAKGALIPFVQANPNPAALDHVFPLAKRGGFDAFMTKQRALDTTRRHKSVLASRFVAPQAMPQLPLTTLDGKPASLASLRGRVAVINFWATWCDWCEMEMPELQRLARQYAGDSRVVITTVDVDAEPATAKRWLDARKFDFPVLFDRDGKDVKAAGVPGYPMTWFVTPDGRIAFDKLGPTEHLRQEFGWRIEALRR